MCSDPNDGVKLNLWWCFQFLYVVTVLLPFLDSLGAFFSSNFFGSVCCHLQKVKIKELFGGVITNNVVSLVSMLTAALSALLSPAPRATFTLFITWAFPHSFLPPPTPPPPSSKLALYLPVAGTIAGCWGLHCETSFYAAVCSQDPSHCVVGLTNRNWLCHGIARSLERGWPRGHTKAASFLGRESVCVCVSVPEHVCVRVCSPVCWHVCSPPWVCLHVKAQ